MKGFILLFILLVGVVYADIYMHNPRGSNNRLSNTNANAQNQNRLFNSENNARGGYNWGPSMTYYEGSILPIEWTAQHGCGSDQVTCNLILQYMCTDPKNDPAAVQIRDGLTETTITDDANFNSQSTVNGVTGYTYGMHESYQYYEECKARQRNYGLFTADQNLNGKTAIYTRQDPNGERYGFQCTEERDYYPYWHPSPWKDIADLVPTLDLCPLFQSQSQNVASKGSCTITVTGNTPAPNNPGDCAASGGTWSVTPAWGIPAPACILANFSRDNHLGNGLDGNTASYNWTIPSNEPCASAGGCNCVLRLRYNISTSDINNWGLDGNGFINASYNTKANSPITQDPVTQVEGDDLQLALNTNQYGRTFEDRSYVFQIAPRPAGIAADTPIYNLNVRGKRGNIVEVFPAVEYDFVPNNLVVNEGDYIHFQWTGADTNPNGNAGEGIAGTDRSNIVQIASLDNNIPLTSSELGASKAMVDDPTLRHSLAFSGQTNCPTVASLLTKNNNNQGQVNVDPTNCAKLNAASAYYNAGAVKATNTGTYYYMSSRNNNFTNRSQKGTIVVNSKANPANLPAGSIAAIVVFTILGVAVAGVAGTYVYGRMKPESRVGEFYGNLNFPHCFSRSSHSAMSYTAKSGGAYTTNGDRQEPLLG